MQQDKPKNKINEVSHPGLTYPAVLSPIQIYPAEIFTRIGERVGGCSVSSAVYKDNQGQISVGKCDISWSPSKDTPNKGVLYKLFNAHSFREKIAIDIFTYYGASTAVTKLAWLPPYLGKSDIASQFTDLKPTVHVISEWIENFKLYGVFPNFDKNQQQHYLQIGETKFPVKGLGSILAVGCFLNDIDVIGGAGGNIGYQIKENVFGQPYVHIYKIDPGLAFRRIDRSKPIDPSTTTMISSRQLKGAAARIELINFDDFPSQMRQEFLLTLHAIVATPDEVIQLFFNRTAGTLCDNPDIDREEIEFCPTFLQITRDTLKKAYQQELQETLELYKSLCEKAQKLNQSPQVIQILHQHAIDQFREMGLSEHYSLVPDILSDMPFTNKRFAFLGESGQLLRFCQDPIKKVWVLFGDAASGKNFTSWMIEDYSWKTYKAETSRFIPLRIDLKHFSPTQVANCVEKTLKDVYQLSDQDIKVLQQMRVLFILNGYDQISQQEKPNLTHQLKAWPNAKMLITCRTRYILESDYPQLFSACGNQIKDWEVYYLAPFSEDQLTKYVARHEELAILKTLIPSATPYLMGLFLEVWPQLSQRQQQSLTSYSLYSVLTKHWCMKEASRTEEQTEENLPRQLELLCSSLALEAYEHDSIKIKSDQWSSQLLKIRDCLLRQSGSNFFFIADLQEYFVAKALLETLHQGDLKQCSILYSKFPVYKKPKVMLLWAEGYKVHASPEVKVISLDLIRNSRKSRKTKKSRQQTETDILVATNLLSLLVAAKVSLAGEDLSGIRTCGVVLDDADLHRTNLAGSRLDRASMRNSYQCEANFRRCSMQGVALGQQPSFLHEKEVTCLAYSHDGALLVTGSGFEIHLWDMITQQKIISLCEHSKEITSIAFSPDNRFVVSGSRDNTVRVWDITNQKQIISLKQHTDWVTAVAFSHGGRYVASASQDKTVQIWDTNNWQKVACLRGHTHWITGVAFGGQYIFSSSADKTVRIWKTHNWQESACIQTLSWINCIIISPDGKYLATGSADNKVRIYIWNQTQWQEIACLQRHTKEVTSIHFSNNGLYLVSSSVDKSICVWDVEKKKLNSCIQQLSSKVMDVASGHNSLEIASSGRDNLVRIRKIENLQEGNDLAPHDPIIGIKSTVISPNNEYLIEGRYDKTIQLWHLGSQKKITSLKGHSKSINSVTCSPNSMYIASSSSGDKFVLVWDIEKQKLVTSLDHQSEVTSAVFSPDGKFLACSSCNGTIQIWETTKWQRTHLLRVDEKKITHIAFSHNSELIASGSIDGTVQIWNIKSQLTVGRLPGSTKDITKIAFGFQDNVILNNNLNHNVRIWNLKSQELICLRGHTDTITGVAIIDSEDQYAVSSSNDGTIRVWDIRNKHCIQILSAHTLGINNIYWDAKNQCLVSCSGDGRTRTWQWHPDKKEFLLQITMGTNTLQAEGAHFENVTGLSSSDLTLLKQLGAFTPNSPTELIRFFPKLDQLTKKKRKPSTPTNNVNNSDLRKLLEPLLSREGNENKSSLREIFKLDQLEDVNQLEEHLEKHLPTLFQLYQLLNKLREQKTQLDNLQKQIAELKENGTEVKSIKDEKYRKEKLLEIAKRYGCNDHRLRFSLTNSCALVEQQLNKLMQSKKELKEQQQALTDTIEKEIIALILNPENQAFLVKIFGFFAETPNDKDLLKELIKNLLTSFKIHGSPLFILKLDLYELFFPILSSISSMRFKKNAELATQIINRLGHATCIEDMTKVLEDFSSSSSNKEINIDITTLLNLSLSSSNDEITGIIKSLEKIPPSSASKELASCIEKALILIKSHQKPTNFTLESESSQTKKGAQQLQ